MTGSNSTAAEIASAIDAVRDGGAEDIGDAEVVRPRESKAVRVAPSKPTRLTGVTEADVREAVAMVDGAEAADHVQQTGDGVVTYHAPAA